jgi:aspartyl-tRNA(Asn)/glutamyl-tRNA(Gln) amidotransferase subunit A
MSADPPIWSRSVEDLSALLDARAFSPETLLETVLARCTALNGTLNALVTIDETGARAAAAASAARQAAGRRLGPLDGLPLSVKDNLYVGGLRATWGSVLYRDFVAPQDDLCVERLRAAGAVIVGKSNTPEFALGAHTGNALFGATRNPWDPSRVPAGSSGGAAASVASGMLPLAIGTDAGGSIRLPAAYCGVVGFKPTVGRIPRLHGFPPMVVDFQSIGLMARSIEGIRLLLDATAAPDPRDRASLAFGPRVDRPAPRTLRIGWIAEAGGEPVEPEVARATADAARLLRELGHEVVETAPVYDLDELVRFWAVLSSVGLARAVEPHAGWEERITPPMAALARTGHPRAATEYVNALDRLAAFRVRTTEAFAPFDLLLTPTSPVLPWPIDGTPPARIAGRDTTPRTPMAFTTFVNAMGYPALSLPLSIGSGGLPIGIQLVGRFGDDGLLLQLGRSIEQAADWRRVWPPSFQPT